MNKKILKILLCEVAMIILTLTTSCGSPEGGHQPVNVHAGKTDIPIFENEENFTNIMVSKSLEDLVYIKNKETVLVEFNGKNPDTISMTEHILNENGSPKFATETKGKIIDVTLEKSKASFKIGSNFATSLSSNGNDFNPGAIIKGYRLVCDWGESESKYFFVIRGDAAITNK